MNFNKNIIQLKDGFQLLLEKQVFQVTEFTELSSKEFQVLMEHLEKEIESICKIQKNIVFQKPNNSANVNIIEKSVVPSSYCGMCNWFKKKNQ